MKTIQTESAPKAIGPYVQGKIVGGFLFASGQIPLNPETMEISGVCIQEQTTQVMENIKGILESVGRSFDAIVKTTCFLSDMENFALFNEVYASYFSEELPARSCVEVARLPKDVLVEVEIIASIE